jgi:hypothetical protein
MEQSTLSTSRTAENRRAARKRKVRPVALVAQAVDAEPSLRTVTANVSRSGMLLVTRLDQFPPAGAGVLLVPFEVSAGAPDSNAAIRGRIVYTRYSPRARLRFAGLKFEQDLSERTARMLGLDGAPDAVSDAITTLDQLEAMRSRAPRMIELSPAAPAMREFGIQDELPAERLAGPTEGGLRAELEAARREFYGATAAYFTQWGEERIRRTLGVRHALARAKGLEGLRAMKSDWNELQRNLAALAETELGRGEESAIEGGAETSPYYNLRLDQPPARMMQALRDLAGHVGRVLLQHGFEDSGAGSDWAPMAHERGRVTFTGTMGISEAMRESLLRMTALHHDLQRADQQAGEARESHARAEVLQLWERA